MKYNTTFKEKYKIGIDDPPHFAQSSDHLLSKNIVDICEDRGLILKWIPEKYTEMFDKWNDLFLNNMLKQKELLLLKPIILNDIHTYPWEMFSSGKIKCYSEDEACKNFDSDNRDFAYLFIYTNHSWCDDWKEQVYELSGSLSARLLNIIAMELGGEVYIFNEKESWTIIYTHEFSLGPYYYIKSKLK